MLIIANTTQTFTFEYQHQTSVIDIKAYLNFATNDIQSHNDFINSSNNTLPVYNGKNKDCDQPTISHRWPRLVGNALTTLLITTE